MFNELTPYCNREKRRKIERYMKKHPGCSFTEAFNKIFFNKSKKGGKI